MCRRVHPQPLDDEDGFDEQVVLEEINLYAELLIAAESSDGPLSQPEIDAVLGVRSERTRGD